LDSAIQNEMQKRRIPALTACIINNADIVWMKSYGRADMQSQIPAASHTIFLLASLSKTVVATAVLQLVERGLIDIDRDISQYLPFQLRNPNHPLAMITPRMVLTHSSGLAGPKTDDELPDFYDWFPADGAPPLSQTFSDYLLPGGSCYVPAVWKASAPGTVELYSNLGYTVLACMVEFVSGEEFSAYCRNHIFLPLGMPGTSYRVADLPAEDMATWYMENGQPIPHYTRRDYPGGQVKSSVEEWARFLAAWMNDGALHEVKILDGHSVSQALTLHNPDSGECLTWYLMPGGWHGHSGGVNGASTYMEFHRWAKVGLIILANMYLESDNPIYPPSGEIYSLIRERADQFRP
jgi:CubicO group peptidase (beta-lactamase class C family)